MHQIKGKQLSDGVFSKSSTKSGNPKGNDKRAVLADDKLFKDYKDVCLKVAHVEMNNIILNNKIKTLKKEVRSYKELWDSSRRVSKELEKEKKEIGDMLLSERCPHNNPHWDCDECMEDWKQKNKNEILSIIRNKIEELYEHECYYDGDDPSRVESAWIDKHDVLDIIKKEMSFNDQAKKI